MSVVTIGHIDSGKSTITGRLLYHCGGIADRRKIIERNHWEFTQLVDTLKADRERGITINVTIWKLYSSKRHYTIINTPGHKDFIKNTLTAASQADAALLVVAAPPAEFEVGISSHGNTKEYAHLAFALGVQHLVVAVNKMDDNMVDFSEARFEFIQKQVSAMVKKIGFSAAKVSFVPLSAVSGDNIVKKSDRLPWWKGPTLLEALDAIETPKRAYEKPLRILIHDVYKIQGIGTVPIGRIVAGELKEGMTVAFAPSNIHAEVSSIEMHHERLETARAGDWIGFNIKNVSVRDIRRGFVASDASQDTAFDCESFLALVMILRHPTQIRNGYSPLICCHTCQIVCKFELVSKMDRQSGNVMEEAPSSLKSGEMCIIKMIPLKPMCVEPYSSCAALGRFSIRDMRETIGVGIVKAVTRKSSIRTKAAVPSI